MNLTEPMKAAIRTGRDGAVVQCDARTEPALVRRGIIHPVESTLTDLGRSILGELDQPEHTPDERECCNYCMWYGPVRKDGTMRKHRPATLDDKWGRPNSVQDMDADPCPGSGRTYARFNVQPVPATARPEPSNAGRFQAGQKIVVGNGTVHTVVKMADRVGNEPQRVEVEGGLQWLADDCEPALDGPDSIVIAPEDIRPGDTVEAINTSNILPRTFRVTVDRTPWRVNPTTTALTDGRSMYDAQTSSLRIIARADG